MAEGLDALFADLKESWTAGDVERFLSNYADDAKYMCNDVPGVMTGKEQIREKVKTELSRVECVDVELLDRVIGTDVVSDMGNFHCKLRGQDKTESSRFMATYVKQDGKWLMKLNVDLWRI